MGQEAGDAAQDRGTFAPGSTIGNFNPEQAWAFLALVLWEFTVALAAVFAPSINLALRGVELGLAASVIVLLFSSAHLFPRAQLPRR